MMKNVSSVQKYYRQRIDECRRSTQDNQCPWCIYEYTPRSILVMMDDPCQMIRLSVISFQSRRRIIEYI